MTYYSVLFITRKSDDWLEGYLPAVNGAIKRQGGHILARTHTHEQIEGINNPAGMRIILRWPSRQSALNFMEDPEYAPHLEKRSKGAECSHFLIEGNDELE